ncbi:MAG: hypothetical protein KGY41_07670 [Desulfovermiculus sp.]|nr:hypothetical protein [Desulfovermiculus sp.]
MEPRLGKAIHKTGRDKLCPYGFEPGSGWDAWAVDQITVLVITVGADLVSARPQEGKRS